MLVFTFSFFLTFFLLFLTYLYFGGRKGEGKGVEGKGGEGKGGEGRGREKGNGI